MHGKIINIVGNFIPDENQKVYQSCLTQEKFPKEWKCAELVLIPKPGKKDTTFPSAYRPTCLISEVGKILEKVM